MLEDAVYYSRREADEMSAAKDCSDLKVRQIHLLLAEKYSQLARNALAALAETDRTSMASAPLELASRARLGARRHR